jgi:AcrR family transcriptional regulator
MVSADRKSDRKNAVGDLKRGLILDAAQKVFEAEGLEGTSLRAIASAAGYTPAALYFHFDSKEAIYGEVLRRSLADLEAAVKRQASGKKGPEDQFRAAALAFFHYYEDNPRELDLGFYLFRGGMKPRGLGKERDRLLNAALDSALSPIATGAQELGASRAEARRVVVDIFAHATGLLVLAHTGRIRKFKVSATDLMKRFIDNTVDALGRA